MNPRIELTAEAFVALLEDISDDDELRHCDECGAICDMRIAYCECDPAVCPYPPVQ